MSAIDRNLIRLAAYEMFTCEEKVPSAVAINEAVELAKIYGSDESAAYINGILGKMAKNHGTGAFDIATGKKIVVPNAPRTYTEVFSDTMLELAENDDNLVAITAAMPDGTGLAPFAKKYPKRFFDVGIAEQHGVYDGIDNAWLTLEDVRQTLGDYIASGDFEPTQLTVIQERLDLLFRLKKKYGGTLEDVKEHLNKAQEEYANIAFLDRNLELAGKRKLELKKQMLEKVAALTACRKQVAEKFAKLVTMHIKDLAMEQGVFQASFTLKEECGLQGRDSVEFLFSANLGMEVKPLQKIASGGELSRLALAIKTVLLEKSGVSTMKLREADSPIIKITVPGFFQSGFVGVTASEEKFFT